MSWSRCEDCCSTCAGVRSQLQDVLDLVDLDRAALQVPLGPLLARRPATPSGMTRLPCSSAIRACIFAPDVAPASITALTLS